MLLFSYGTHAVGITKSILEESVVEILEHAPASVTVGVEGVSVVLPRVSADARRSIYETPYQSGVLQFFHIHGANLPLGKHYHREKTEVFTIVTGGGQLCLCTVDAAGVQSGEIVIMALRPASVVPIVPHVAHTFYLEPGSEMLCVSSLPFDADDMPGTPWLVRAE